MTAGVPDAFDLEGQIDLEGLKTLFALANCEGMDGISEVDADQVNA